MPSTRGRTDLEGLCLALHLFVQPVEALHPLRNALNGLHGRVEIVLHAGEAIGKLH